MTKKQKQTETKKDFIEEQCPYCDSLVELPAHKGIYQCPECTELITACSMCDMDKVNCNECKFELAKKHWYSCVNCENETNLKLADLQIEYDKLKKYVNLLEQCIDNSQALNQTLREDNERLRNKLSIYGG